MGNSASSSKKGCFGVGGRTHEIDEEADRPACYSSTKCLSEIRQLVIELMSLVKLALTSRPDPEVPWFHVGTTNKMIIRSSHLQAVLYYILQLEGGNSSYYISDDGVPDLVRWDVKDELFDHDNLDEMFESYVRDISELFSVLTHPSLLPGKAKTLKNIAAFVDFLLRLLHIHTTESIKSLEGEAVGTLKNDLRFIATILGDAPFQDSELELVKNLLAEFEGMANDAGRLVYSVIFNTHPISISVLKNNGKAVYALSKRIEKLKAKIIEGCKHITKTGITLKIDSAGSLFNVNSLLCDLEDLMSLKDGVVVDVKGQIKSLHEELMLCDSLLNAVNVSRLSEIPECKQLATQSRFVVDEADYLINSFLIGDAPPWYCSIRLPHVTQGIKLIGTELQKMKKDRDIGDSDVANNISSQISLRAKGNISEVDDIIIGFEEKATDILDQLVGGREKLQIISIVGMPGLGKTTFAKYLYNHPLVKYHFHKCSWCVVSQTYQRRSVFSDILISSTTELGKVEIFNMEEESLIQHVYKSLKGRRYLIVIDDIWSSNVWDDLRRYFPDDGNGSRILFTSRNKDVAPPNSIIYVLPFLSNDQCWELLEKKVFQKKPCPPKLLPLGKKIATNCHGLPLAVVVIAGILSTMDSKENTWKKVGDSLASYIFSCSNGSTMQILELSYKHLPDHLKPCFLYFGAFPEDKKVSARELMKLWIAEGFIRKEQGRSSESIAEEYLMELIDKSLVMVVERRSDGGVKACVIHDLLRDLCLRMAGEENFLKLIDSTNTIYEKHQRLRISTSQGSSKLLGASGPHVRAIFGSYSSSTLDVFNTKLLKVLDLRNTKLSDSEAIKHLVRLKYLAIKNIHISILSCLVNLEFLLLMMEIDIFSLTLSLLKLRYLQVADIVICENGYYQTNSLEFISRVTISSLEAEWILKRSPKLCKLKCICKPLLVRQGIYRFPDLCCLTRLESLNMKFQRGEMVDISFPPSIKKLTVSGLWLTWDKMSVIGRLPNLQVLKLGANAIVGETWETRDDEFQQLTFLKLEWLGVTKWNVETRHFPKLQKLVLHVCILEIPCEIGEIPTLQSIEIRSCPKHVVESVSKIEWEQREMGNEELRVVIR